MIEHLFLENRMVSVSTRVRLMAVASGGGHWEQLMLIRSAFSECETVFVTTLVGLPEKYEALPAHIVRNCDRKRLGGLATTTTALAFHLFRFRPDVVVSTGALPGLVAIVLGRAIGCRTIWIDSVANAEKLSLSGRWARRLSHHCMSQWSDVALRDRVDFFGSVL